MTIYADPRKKLLEAATSLTNAWDYEGADRDLGDSAKPMRDMRAAITEIKSLERRGSVEAAEQAKEALTRWDTVMSSEPPSSERNLRAMSAVLLPLLREKARLWAEVERLTSEVADWKDNFLAAREHGRPVLTEERAQEIWEGEIKAWSEVQDARTVDEIAIALLLRVSRGDFGEPSPAAPQASGEQREEVASEIPWSHLSQIDRGMHPVDPAPQEPPVRRCVAVLCTNAAEQVCLVRNKKREKWELPGGGVHDGELPSVAAGREMEEETGLRPTLSEAEPVELHGDPVPGAAYHSVVLVFRARAEGQPVPGDDAAEARWVERDVVLQLAEQGSLSPLVSAKVLLEWARQLPRGVVVDADFEKQLAEVRGDRDFLIRALQDLVKQNGGIPHTNPGELVIQVGSLLARGRRAVGAPKSKEAPSVDDLQGALQSALATGDWSSWQRLASECGMPKVGPARPKAGPFVKSQENTERYVAHDAHGHSVAEYWQVGDVWFFSANRPFAMPLAGEAPSPEAAEGAALAVLRTWADVEGEEPAELWPMQCAACGKARAEICDLCLACEQKQHEAGGKWDAKGLALTRAAVEAGAEPPAEMAVTTGEEERDLLENIAVRGPK